MDIQTKIDLCMTADFKDWGYYKTQEKIRELKELIEKITDEDALNWQTTKEVNRDA